MALPWSATQIYALGETVTFDAGTWTSTQNYNYNHSPVLGSDWWSGGGGGGGGVSGVAVDSFFTGNLRLASSNGGPSIMPGALTTGDVYIGATSVPAGGVALDSTYGLTNNLRLSDTDGGGALAPGILASPAYLGFFSGESVDLAGSDFSLPAVPAPGSSASTTVLALQSSRVRPGVAYLVTFSFNMVNADSPGGTPHAVQFDTGTDYVEVVASGATIMPTESITEAIICAFLNRPAAGPQLFDAYTGTLLLQTDPGSPASDINLTVSVFNRSGTLNYGSFSSFGAQICALVCVPT